MFNFTLRQLEIFLTVSKTLNMSIAAQKLNMTQAAVSMAIKELEQFLFERLFDRSNNKLFLTESGRSFVVNAQKVYDMAKELEEQRSLTTIKISASSTIGNYILPLQLGNYLKNNKDVYFLLSVKNTDQVISDVLNFEADIGFIEGYWVNPQITATIFAQDNLYIFCSGTNKISDRKCLSLEEVLAMKWILREKGSGTREVIEHTFRDKLNLMNVYMELGHSEAIKNAVIGDMGISCLSEFVIKSNVDLGILKIIDTDVNPIQRNLYLIMNKDKYANNALKRFMEFISMRKL